jgi:DNA-binding XRE family transcriptional regulator
MNHPNRSRSRKTPGANPSPEKIAKTREEADLTQTQAAEMIYSTMRTWQQWEGGQRRMHPALWEYWCLLISDRSVRQARMELFGNTTEGAPIL